MFQAHPILDDHAAFHRAARPAVARLASIPVRSDNAGMALELTTSYLRDSLEVFHYYKKLAERAMAQIADDQFCTVPDEESNSIATIVKHMAGNMRSRWTDFLTTDGESLPAIATRSLNPRRLRAPR